VILNAEGGLGTISSGQLVDQDFSLPLRQGLFSESISPTLNDNLRYLNVELGWRFCEGACYAIDGLVGYQYWSERYIDDGGTQSVGAPRSPAPPPFTSFPPGPGISEHFTWQGFRIGVQTVANVWPCWAVKARVMAMPVTWFVNEDVHFLRSLSGTERATGGIGVMGDVRVAYRLWQGLILECGYRVWYAESGSGELTEHLSDGTLFSNGTSFNQLPFNKASSLRQGLVLGLTYQF
jgi:hypothetical protein